jgi:hypothetical protein
MHSLFTAQRGPMEARPQIRPMSIRVLSVCHVFGEECQAGAADRVNNFWVPLLAKAARGKYSSRQVAAMLPF